MQAKQQKKISKSFNHLKHCIQEMFSFVDVGFCGLTLL